MQKIFFIFSYIFEKITKKKLLYLTPNKNNSQGRTAVKSEVGFWYTGNVYDSKDIAYGIAQNGLVERDDTELVIKILSSIKDPVVYDIGANTGYYGILAATKFRAIVHSFEPIQEYISCIEESAFINRIDGIVHTHKLALGSQKGTLELNLSGSGSSLTNSFLGSEKLPKIEVAVETLDDLNIQPPKFIKIDVEGFEWEVLKGAKNTISKHRPICFIEIAKTFSERNFIHQNWNEIVKYFTDLDYNIQRNTPTGLLSIDNEIPDGVFMYLFTPKTTQIKS